MICNIPKLQNDFNMCLRLRTELQTKRDTLEEKIDDIKAQYNDLVRQNSKKIYLYCLDSMYFQYKILRVELEQFQKMIALIFNRMYGDYYKLYNIIQSQCKENSTNIILSSENVVVYKDLDPFTEFSVEDLALTHRIIIETLKKLLELYATKQEEINDHNANMRVGFSVTSFISTLSYENKILGEHMSLYSDYLSFYHSSQRKYLDNALGKINSFMREIEDEILTNHKSSKKETITIVESIVEEESEVKEEKSEVKDEEVKDEEVKEEVKQEEVKEEVKQEEVTQEVKVKITQEVKVEMEVKEEEVKEEKEEETSEKDDGFQTVARGGKNGKHKKR
jgi:hypothetical protein